MSGISKNRVETDLVSKFQDLLAEYSGSQGDQQFNLIELSKEQQKAIDIYAAGKNLLIIGPAGCGKTKSIEEIIKYTNKNYFGKRVYITAMSGVAAYNCGGVTVQSFLGIGTGEADAEVLIKRVLRKRGIAERLRNTDALIIDEFSMMSAELFEKIDKVCRAVRRNHKNFMGGIQLILCGDLLQILPVFNKNEGIYGEQDTRLIFESELFNHIFSKKTGNIVELKKNFRQDNKSFVETLLRIRKGEHTESDVTKLQDRLLHKMKLDEESIQDAVYLVVSNKKAQMINESNMNSIENKTVKYTANFSEQGDKEVTQELLRELQSQFKQKGIMEIELKQDARVMLIKNLSVEEGLVNGSVGKIKSFEKVGIKTCPLVEFDNGTTRVIEEVEWELEYNDSKAKAVQLPLMLAWSCTIHKIQGCTLEKAVMDLSDCFCDGQVYVALSRVKTLDGVYLKTFDARKIMVNEKVKNYLNK